MKIAAVTDDGLIFSQHFGWAAYCWAVTIENGVIVHEEKRDKVGRTHFAGETHTDDHSAGQHGLDPVAQNRHTRMLDTVRGMGKGSYESIRQAGIKPVVTDEESIDIAVQQYLAGCLIDHVERLH